MIDLAMISLASGARERSARGTFTTIGTVLLAWLTVGALVSIVAGWPTQFGGEGDPDRVLAEFFTRGTSLTAPFPLLAVFALAVVLSRRADGLGAAGIGAGMVLAIVFTIGSLGEVFAPATPDVPGGILVAGGVVGAALSLATLVAGTLAVRERARGRRDGHTSVREWHGPA